MNFDITRITINWRQMTFEITSCRAILHQSSKKLYFSFGAGDPGFFISLSVSEKLSREVAS
jgi:hypothetical protein